MQRVAAQSHRILSIHQRWHLVAPIQMAMETTITTTHRQIIITAPTTIHQMLLITG